MPGENEHLPEIAKCQGKTLLVLSLIGLYNSHLQICIPDNKVTNDTASSVRQDTDFITAFFTYKMSYGRKVHV